MEWGKKVKWKELNKMKINLYLGPNFMNLWKVNLG